MSVGKIAISPCTCVNVRRISGLISDLYDQCLEPVGLTISQYSSLANLNAMPNASISDLAARVGLDRTTLVRNLKPLMERGLIEDLAQPGRRNRQLVLTPAGQTLLGQGRVLWQSAQDQLSARLGQENIQVIRTVLRQLQE